MKPVLAPLLLLLAISRRTRVTDMRRLTMAGLIAALTLGTFVASASAQGRPSYWPPVVNSGVPCPGTTTPLYVVCESFSDVPWHQKLGTYAHNELDEALILPYDALPQANKDWCTANKKTNPQCMIETGVNSIIGIARTDTLYDFKSSAAIQNAKRCPPNPASYDVPCTPSDLYCQNPNNPSDPTRPNSLPCIEVKLSVSMYWNRGNNVMVQRLIGDEPPTATSGFVLTDGTNYAPQMPWYMSHNCYSQLAAGPLSVVCYADYISDMNDGFNACCGKGLPDWPNGGWPWSVSPGGNSFNPNHCKPNITTCTWVMAGFDLDPVKKDVQNSRNLQYVGQYQTDNLKLLNNVGSVGWFDNALVQFPINQGKTDLQHHFPWPGAWNGQPAAQQTWANDVYPQAVLNPFLGQFSYQENGIGSGIFVPQHYLYPRQCSLADVASQSVAKLRQCGLDYELHPNGWGGQWPNTSDWQAAILAANIFDLQNKGPNQYGRTSFLLAGVPGMQMPVSFYKIPTGTVGRCSPTDRCSIYEQVHNASLFSLYLPIANEADNKMAMQGRNYTDLEFYHTLLMTNHMESAPEDFAEGIRGKTLWHDEYRSQGMFQQRNLACASAQSGLCFPTVRFPASFEPATAPAPFHDYTCDGCHVRNGSGIPINPLGMLDACWYEVHRSHAT